MQQPGSTSSSTLTCAAQSGPSRTVHPPTESSKCRAPTKILGPDADVDARNVRGRAWLATARSWQPAQGPGVEQRKRVCRRPTPTGAIMLDVDEAELHADSCKICNAARTSRAGDVDEPERANASKLCAMIASPRCPSVGGEDEVELDVDGADELRGAVGGNDEQRLTAFEVGPGSPCAGHPRRASRALTALLKGEVIDADS